MYWKGQSKYNERSQPGKIEREYHNGVSHLIKETFLDYVNIKLLQFFAIKSVHDTPALSYI